MLVWRDAQRRRSGRWSLARRSWTGLFTAGWIFCCYAFFVEPTFLIVRHVAIESAGWRGAPLRIGLIADTHVGGPHMPAARVRQVVARMNSERPDLVVLLGDYVDGHRGFESRTAAQNQDIADGIRAFSALNAPLGAVAAWGNHDWWYGGPAIAEAFVASGIPLIENGAARVERADGPFFVADLGDFLSPYAQPSYQAAMHPIDRKARVIAIMHRPDMFADAPARVALTLAGHTHCGQIRIPVLSRSWMPGDGARRWPCGAYVDRGRHLYVTGGLGESGIPARFNAPPEIVIVTLSAPETKTPRRKSRGAKSQEPGCVSCPCGFSHLPPRPRRDPPH